MPGHNCTGYLEGNSNPMFLGEKKEIINIVENCKDKTSTDWTDIDMHLVKKVIDGIVDPLTHICNLSFRRGIFPEKNEDCQSYPIT